MFIIFYNNYIFLAEIKSWILVYTIISFAYIWFSKGYTTDYRTWTKKISSSFHAKHTENLESFCRLSVSLSIGLIGGSRNVWRGVQPLMTYFSPFNPEMGKGLQPPPPKKSKNSDKIFLPKRGGVTTCQCVCLSHTTGDACLNYLTNQSDT